MPKNQFEQQFQDSQANFSQAAPGGGISNMTGFPVQLIKISRNGKLQVNQEALSIIGSYNADVGFISVVGKSRTGKSCLLNRLLGLSGRGASTKSCTEGIWMWSEPQFNPSLNCYVFYLDTQGSDSLQKDSDNDAKIFTMALLISSYFVYNSVGNIDQRSLSDLQMVTALSRKIKTDDKISERQNQQNLYQYMPQFLWVLRDFTLKIQDKQGKNISPTLYLQNCLNDQGSSYNQDSKKVKKSLLTYFKKRQCMTLVRPVGDQDGLRRLDTIPDHALRRQFLQGVATLRDKLVNNCGPKSMGGDPLNGPTMAQLIQVFVDSFNSGKVPSIKSAWQQIEQEEGISAYNAAIQRFQQIFHEQFPNDTPKTQQQLRRSLAKLRQETLKRFNQSCVSQKQVQHNKKIRQFLQKKQNEIAQINRNMNQTRNNEILKDLSKKMKTKFESNAYIKNKKQIQTDLDEVIKKYNEQAKGQTKAQILSEFIGNINKVLISMQDNNTENQQQKRQQKRKRQQLQQINKSKQQQIQSLKKQIKNQSNQIPKPSKTNSRPPKQDRGSQGCCSGDKCQIM